MYYAPEARAPNVSYQGGPADVWQCGVVLIHFLAYKQFKLWQKAHTSYSLQGAFPFRNWCSVCKISFPSGQGAGDLSLSPELCDMLDRIFAIDPTQRLTAQQVTPATPTAHSAHSAQPAAHPTRRDAMRRDATRRETAGTLSGNPRQQQAHRRVIRDSSRHTVG